MTTLTERALRYIAEHPGARSPQIAEHIKTDPKNISGLLQSKVRSGQLVTCDVISGGRKMLEYRLSATAGLGEAPKTNGGSYLPPTAKQRPPRIPDHARRPETFIDPETLSAELLYPAQPEVAQNTGSVSSHRLPEHSCREGHAVASSITPAASPAPGRNVPGVTLSISGNGTLSISTIDHPTVTIPRTDIAKIYDFLTATQSLWRQA